MACWHIGVGNFSSDAVDVGHFDSHVRLRDGIGTHRGRFGSGRARSCHRIGFSDGGSGNQHCHNRRDPKSFRQSNDSDLFADAGHWQHAGSVVVQ